MLATNDRFEALERLNVSVYEIIISVNVVLQALDLPYNITHRDDWKLRSGDS